MIKPRTSLVVLLTAAALGWLAGPAEAQQPAVATESPTFDSAVFLLRASTQPRRDGRHHVLLRALRHLADPQLAPLFEELAGSTTPSLRIHGILGLAECSAKHQLDLARIAAIESGPEQAELISAALENELLSDEQAMELYQWQGLDAGVKVVVATQLVEHGKLSDQAPLRQALPSDNLARRGLVTVMLLQLGDKAMEEELDRVNRSEDPRRDDVREMMLSTAVRCGFDRAGPWAMRVATEPGVGSRLGLTALGCAMRFKAPGAADVWRQQFESTADAAQRTRLALTALRFAAWQEPAMFDPVIAADPDSTGLLPKIGAAGKAMAAGKGVAEAVAALIQQHHLVSNRWALSYARREATPENATAIFVALIKSYRDGPQRGRTQRLDDAVLATQLLYERDPQAAAATLRPMLSDRDGDAWLSQGIVLGLIRARGQDAHPLLQDLMPLPNDTANSLAILVLAKNGQKLSPDQMDALELLARGGGLDQEALRIQAAWAYLKLTSQIDKALTAALRG